MEGEEEVFKEESVYTEADAMYEMEEEMKKIDKKRIYDKRTVLNKKLSYEILGVGKNKFGKPMLEINDGNGVYILNINSTIFDQLIDRFGSKPKNWIKKRIILEGKDFQMEKDGELKQGVELRLLD